MSPFNLDILFQQGLNIRSQLNQTGHVYVLYYIYMDFNHRNVINNVNYQVNFKKTINLSNILSAVNVEHFVTP
jgi:hypothetical protein